MIIGLGIDLVDVEAFAAQLDQPGSAFEDGTFTARELATLSGSVPREQQLAARFAAKEAFVKAWSGIRVGPPVLPGIDLALVEVVPDDWGRPSLTLHGDLAAVVDRSVGPVDVRVSLTHEPHSAAAVVVLAGGESPCT